MRQNEKIMRQKKVGKPVQEAKGQNIQGKSGLSK